MVKKVILENRDEWLTVRAKRLGGSDASACLGKNPWMTNLKLWELKTMRAVQPDISEVPSVKFGVEAEPSIRELFRLDHPELKVFYEPNNIWFNDKLPFAHASLDGWLEDERGRLGVLEIKTSTISSRAQRDKWFPDNANTRYCQHLPENYLYQAIHCMNVIEADFVWLRAYLRFTHDGFYWIEIKDYYFEKTDENIQPRSEELMEAEARFWKYVESNEEPALILPEL